MGSNVGWVDRALRLALGIVVLGLYRALEAPVKYLMLLGLIPLGTALVGACPIYTRRPRPRPGADVFDRGRPEPLFSQPGG
jgi:hypothetical protein